MIVQSDALAATTSELVDDLLAVGSTVHFAVISRSMSPTLLLGDRLTVRGVKPDRLRPGDVVLVRDEGTFVAHRLIGRHNERGNPVYVTKGDNSPVADNRWSTAQVCGIVEATEREGQTFSLLTRWARGFSILIVLFSRVQWFVYGISPNPIQRILFRVVSFFLRVASLLGNWKVRAK